MRDKKYSVLEVLVLLELLIAVIWFLALSNQAMFLSHALNIMLKFNVIFYKMIIWIMIFFLLFPHHDLISGSASLHVGVPGSNRELTLVGCVWKVGDITEDFHHRRLLCYTDHPWPGIFQNQHFSQSTNPTYLLPPLLQKCFKCCVKFLVVLR